MATKVIVTDSTNDAVSELISGSDPLLTPAEVARIFAVDPKTVTRWAKSGKLSSIRTPGGHRRFRESVVRALITRGHIQDGAP